MWPPFSCSLKASHTFCHKIMNPENPQPVPLVLSTWDWQRMPGESVLEKMSWSKVCPQRERETRRALSWVHGCPSSNAVICHHLQGPPVQKCSWMTSFPAERFSRLTHSRWSSFTLRSNHTPGTASDPLSEILIEGLSCQVSSCPCQFH